VKLIILCPVIETSNKLKSWGFVRFGHFSLSQRLCTSVGTYAPGFHDLIFGVLRDAGIIPKVRQTAGEMPTLISLVDSGMGVAILPASAVKRSVASVVACEIADEIPMSEIGIAVRKRNRAPIVENFRSLALEKLRRARGALFANRR
jgi:DNA-binding transcriptional LysR family regulator